MPLDPPAPSRPPTDTDPSPPPLPVPPAPEHETVWRHTFLAQFANPTDRAALQRFGRLLYAVTLAADCVGNRNRLVAADDLDGVADDLDALAAALREIAEVPEHLVLGPENRDLCREATDWEGRLNDLAHEIRCRVQEVEGVLEMDPTPDPEPSAARAPEPIPDRPLGHDVREADRIARRLAAHHPDPEARRLYRQLVGKAEAKRESWS